MKDRRKLNLDMIVIALLFTNRFTDSDRKFLQEVRPHRTFVVNDADLVEWQLMEESTFYRIDSLNATVFSGSILEEQIVITVLGMTSRGKPQRIIHIKVNDAFLKEHKISLKRIKELFEKTNAEVQIDTNVV
jgi:hypothetical protein